MPTPPVTTPRPVEPPRPKVFIETFGCQMNALDSELVLGALIREDGYVPTDDMDAATLVLFNTCSVREHAEDKVWSRLGELRRRKQRDPGLVIGVLGCMAQKEQENLARRAPHIDLIVGTHEFGELPRLVREVQVDRETLVATDLAAPIRLQRDVTVRPEKHRAYVSVQRGCDMGCTFCVVPFTRGPETYRPIPEIQEEVQRLADDGVREVTLLGQTVDSYGKRLPGRPNLGDLLEAIHDTPGIVRIRFITSHPMLLSDEILRRVGTLPRVCPYVHMPAQSGSDAVLKRMRRGYTLARYREVVSRARALVPDLALAGDFIVGFPGETAEEFAATVDLVREIRYQQLFIFKYSPRPHTVAWDTLPDDVPNEVKRRRNTELLALQESIQAEENRKLVGQTVEVLAEGASKTDVERLAGRSRENRLVIFDGPPSLEGARVPVLITGSTALALYGGRAGPPREGA